MSESLLSRTKIYYENHPDYPDIMKMIRRAKAKKRAK